MNTVDKISTLPSAPQVQVTEAAIRTATVTTTKSATLVDKSGFAGVASAITEAFCYLPQSKGGKGADARDSWSAALARALGELAAKQ